MNGFHMILTIIMEILLATNMVITIATQEASVISFVLISIVAMIAMIPPRNGGGGRFA